MLEHHQDKHQRVVKGLESQDAVSIHLEGLGFLRGVPVTVLSSATYGQKANDISLSVDGFKFGVEVKGARSKTSSISVFDKSVRRRSVPQPIEEMASAYIQSLSVGGASLKRLMSIGGYPLTFLGILDFFRDYNDPSVGLAEDSNSASSGKLPRELVSSDPFVLKSARDLLLKNLKDSRDSYLAIHDKSDDDVRLFFSGYGKNHFMSPRLPSLKKVSLETYGGSSKGATRIALKILL